MVEALAWIHSRKAAPGGAVVKPRCRAAVIYRCHPPCMSDHERIRETVLAELKRRKAQADEDEDVTAELERPIDEEGLGRLSTCKALPRRVPC